MCGKYKHTHARARARVCVCVCVCVHCLVALIFNYKVEDCPLPCHSHAADQYITCSPETWNIMTFVTKVIVPYHNWFAPLHIIFVEIYFHLFSNPRPGLPVVFKTRSFIHTSCRLFYFHIQSCQWGRVSAVGIATSYGLDHLGIESRQGQKLVSSPLQSIPDLGHTQPPVQCVTGIFSPDG
jgi:hypothetical protein